MRQSSPGKMKLSYRIISEKSSMNTTSFRLRVDLTRLVVRDRQLISRSTLRQRRSNEAAPHRTKLVRAAKSGCTG
jgi:hypothetical protein